MKADPNMQASLHPSDLLLLMRVIEFAAERHKNQRRKGIEASPYINHPIAVTTLLVETGVHDLVILQAALLHDTIEDTETTPEELETRFGREVRLLVQEVTDDKNLPKEIRKRRRIEYAAKASTAAKMITLADKINNIRDVAKSPPVGWGLRTKRKYLEWAEEVFNACRGCNQALERCFQQTMEQSLAVMDLSIQDS